MNAFDKTFLHLELKTQAIAIGERIKGGTFRPCIENIPTSTLKGAFKKHFGLGDIFAIGFFREGTFEKNIFTYAPFDTFLGTAKLPISLEYLKPAAGVKAIEADIYVVKNEAAISFAKLLPTEIFLGALKTKGFGRCKLQYINSDKEAPLKIGYLRGRLLEEEQESFRIVKVIKQCYGYLFYPTSEIDGVYKRALFEGSIIKGPEILLKEEYKYDY